MFHQIMGEECPMHNGNYCRSVVKKINNTIPSSGSFISTVPYYFEQIDGEMNYNSKKLKEGKFDGYKLTALRCYLSLIRLKASRSPQEQHRSKMASRITSKKMDELMGRAKKKRRIVKKTLRPQPIRIRKKETM